MSIAIKNDLSLILILGLVCKNVPISFFQPFLAKAMKKMQKKHSGIFNRISKEEFDFTIDPINLPFVFYLKPSEHNPILLAIKRTENASSSATIRGKLEDLFRLFEGKVDGDAMFFSQDLIIEGSTAATVALRNAIDGEDMDIITDLSEMFSPLDKIIKKYTKFSINKYISIQNTVDIITSNLLLNTNKDLEIIKNQLYDIEENLDVTNAQLKRILKEDIRKKSDYKNQ